MPMSINAVGTRKAVTAVRAELIAVRGDVIAVRAVVIAVLPIIHPTYQRHFAKHFPQIDRSAQNIFEFQS